MHLETTSCQSGRRADLAEGMSFSNGPRTQRVLRNTTRANNERIKKQEKQGKKDVKIIE
jgi:hypothetical protein